MNNFVTSYLEKNNFQPEIAEAVHPDLNICVVVPCYNEPDLIKSLQSLYNCERPQCAVEVIVVINSPEGCEQVILERNEIACNEATGWIAKHYDPKLRFFIIQRPNLPEKFAGVGLARKIGMDEAVFRLHKINRIKGLIAGFDADSVCGNNYLVEMERHFKDNSKTNGASVYFEHPVSGNDFEPDIYTGIVLYELHLRYLQRALRYAGHPHAFHTVGSSFAVRMDAYVRQGGMNRKKAGEDFYFLQKIIALGNYSEINSTRITPSPRVSDRVPFGTGASMQRWHASHIMETYALEVFKDLKQFIDNVDQLYQTNRNSVQQHVSVLSKPLQEFLELNNFITEWTSIDANSASLPAFKKRFFRWFNAFRVIKYLNFTSGHIYKKVEVTLAAKELLEVLGMDMGPDGLSLLEVFRSLDRSSLYLCE